MELDHIFHPSHKLTYNKSVDIKSEVCAACYDDISLSEHYSCAECKFFLHKLCAQRPLELTHSLHPKHPLRLLQESPFDNTANCDSCMKKIEGFVYHCEICNFDLDFICAFPDGSKHVYHPEHVLTYQNSEKWFAKGVVCAACYDDISLSEHYSCAECNFFLHKLCSQRPLELTHPLHPLHPLHLFSRSGGGRCDSCEKILEGCVYRCEICDFDLHSICAFPGGLKLNHLGHHEHVLTYEKVTKKAGKGVVCAACLEEISGALAECYSCRECDFFLHKLCAQRPRELTHELHPLHPLRLLQKRPYTGPVPAGCDSCEKTLEGFIYHCRICEFSLDFICAFPDGLKLNHVGHPQHVLTYEKVGKKADKGLVCAACLKEISGPLADYYSCRTCNFFLHELCSRRPAELTSSLHPQHPLRLLSKDPHKPGKAFCCACKKPMKGFVYDCSLCNKFFLDFKCAFPKEKYHVCHPRHILTYEKLVKTADKGVVCAACLEEINEHQADCYSCRECNFFLHELCSRQPVELTSSLHPQHALCLVSADPYDSGVAFCCACKKPMKGFVYDCSLCNKFFLDFRCASFEQKYHVCHPRHVLTYEKLVKKADKGVVCAACLGEISGPLADYYSCRECNFFLHELCSRQPVELISSRHSQHPLRLLAKDPLKSGKGLCRGCGKLMKGFVYDCSRCQNFCLDFKCALPKPENRIQNFEELHHHPLIFQPKAAKFSCNLCSSTGGERDKEDQSYLCSICEFWIHKSCAHTKLAKLYKGHPHELSLVQGVPKELQIYDGFNCDVCHSTISPEDQVSHCPRCRYFVHFRCMITDDSYLISSIKDGVDYLDDSFFKHLFMDDEFVLVRWPPRDISSELIQPLLLGKRGIVIDVQPKIRHFSHEQHDMILFEEQAVNNDKFFEEEDEEILCDACIHPITAPYYCCEECNYFLHLACANLPSQINHFSHSHKLKLKYYEELQDIFSCDRCGQLCNGFTYRCKTCDFSLDLTCAALPAVIMHETHEHPLFQMTPENEARCYACGRIENDGDVIFKCTFCDVYLHYYCAMLSRHIRHRWDRHHPLVLRFPPHAEHPDHFMCDMCEGELIHPMRWLYSCFECDISFHTRCAPRYERFPNIKYGRKLQTSFHPHILQYLRKPTLRNTCDECENKFDRDDVFECDTCYDCFCHLCTLFVLLD